MSSSPRRMVGRFGLAAACLIIILYLLAPSLQQRSPDSRIETPAAPSTPFISWKKDPLPLASLEQIVPYEANVTVSSSRPGNAVTQEQRSPDCNVIKLSMLYGAHKFPQLEAAVESHRQHSLRWGCEFDSLEYELTDQRQYSKQYFVLSKILQELAKPPEERVEWVMWADADAIVINPALPPNIFLPPEHLPHVFALMTADHQGLNAGVFYLKVHRKSVELLTQTVDYPFSHPTEDLGWFGEQAAMANVIQSMEAQLKKNGEPRGFAWIPRTWINTYEFENGYEGSPGHLMVHFAGLGATRIFQMSQWLMELEANGAKWEVPLEDTSYQEEIATFWDNFTKQGP